MAAIFPFLCDAVFKSCETPRLAAFYLHKVDQCARLAVDAAEPGQHRRFECERREWVQILAREIGAEASVEALEAAIASCRWMVDLVEHSAL